MSDELLPAGRRPTAFWAWERWYEPHRYLQRVKVVIMLSTVGDQTTLTIRFQDNADDEIVVPVGKDDWRKVYESVNRCKGAGE